jgi:hypothetical protein
VAAAPTAPPRRIGTILVERGLITEGELELALAEQKGTGRPLGEICVTRFGLDRLSLADALAEQWEEIQRTSGVEPVRGDDDDDNEDAAAGSDPSGATEDQLHALLAEAQAARDELTQKTDELSRRLALLETLVIGVTDALSELRSRPAMIEVEAQPEPAQPQPRARRTRSSTRAASAKAA